MDLPAHVSASGLKSPSLQRSSVYKLDERTEEAITSCVSTCDLALSHLIPNCLTLPPTICIQKVHAEGLPVNVSVRISKTESD